MAPCIEFKYIDYEKNFQDEIKKKAFFIIFKGLSMKEITYIFLEGESPTLDI